MEIYCKECKQSKSATSEFFKPHVNGKLYAPCRQCRAHYSREWRRKNRKKCQEYDKSIKRKQYGKIYREENREYFVTWRKENRKSNTEYVKNRLKNDPPYRACFQARNRVIRFMKDKCKFSRKLGCSFEQFKKHIESLFQPGMTWENYGQWHIDHKYPLSIAYKEGPESFAKACLFSNLQPLWAIDNLRKSNKVPQSL